MSAQSKRPGLIRASVLKWLGVPIHLTDGEFWKQFNGAHSSAGMAVNQDAVLKLSAAWSCVRLISETIATLPLSMYEKTSSGKRVASHHPLHFILHDQPNSETTAAVHWEAKVAAMLLRGNGRCEKLMIGGKLVGLVFLHPDRLTWFKRNGLKVWRYTEEDGLQREIPNDRIWTIPGFSLDGKEGVSVIAYGAEVFGAAIGADSAANSTFARGLMPTTAITYPGTLKPDQRNDARTSLEAISGAVNAGRPVILEAGSEIKTIGINPADAQLLESRAFSVEEICRWFRVPPFMVGHSEKSTSWGTGIEQQMIGFLTFTLGPWLRRIEQAISKDLLTPAERQRYYPKFAVEGLLRADSAGRASFYAAMVNNGILTRDEVRELEDREPMGGNAAVLTVQTALAPLDKLGQSEDGNAARASLRAFLGVSDPTTKE
ncbi:phage portal protein [Stenotrophomonas indicatrix]|uniref:phage portal protein n=1 Tax=Stenotrophomonas indicatrix TaxID=2045451 RepID=UPI001CBAF21E|nr:phage portal protein [Stenotrophomonas indicatrix]